MFFDRVRLEGIENQSLAPYGICSANSKGRLYPEDEPLYRTRFQRDRDRIIHTTAFRRLEYKTQVFINTEGDYYRTRLTHTLEVVQIGRTIARALGANEDLVEAICLAHDIGHPPFGHSGELCLANLMKNYGGFEHNKQSLRIVTKMEHRYTDFPGLNLTWEVLEGIVKHETEYDHTDARDFNPELRGHLEAQITNLADEIAYTTHDLDDGLRSGILTPPMLAEIDIWKLATEHTGFDSMTFNDMTRHRAIRHLLGSMISDVIETTQANLEKNKVTSVPDVQSLPHNVVCASSEMARLNKQLKTFLYKSLYRNYRVMRMTFKAERILNDLFDAYHKEPTILPRHVQQEIETKSLERTICDYTAGMTDRYAVEEHQRLFDSSVLP